MKWDKKKIEIFLMMKKFKNFNNLLNLKICINNWYSLLLLLYLVWMMLNLVYYVNCLVEQRKILISYKEVDLGMKLMFY